MPPKKSSGSAHTATSKNKKSKKDDESTSKTNEDQATEEGDAEPQHADTKKPSHNNQEENSEHIQKRKVPPTSSSKDKPPKKEPRVGGRTSSRQPGGETANSATPTQVLNFLLSAKALPYCFPSDELDAAKSGNFNKTYSLTSPSHLTPFEHLITAHLLSKPLSHTLGMRSTRTLLNEPYAFSTPGKLHVAGEENIWRALEEARTQHRQKTASYLAQLGEQYADPDSKGDSGGQEDSGKMRELAEKTNEGSTRETIEFIKKTVKGMGETGAQIFCRRVQACDGWGEALWPYADPKSIDALRELGVKVADGDDLQETIGKEVDFALVEKNGGLGFNENEMGAKKPNEKVIFVTVLERAIGCVLEGKMGELRSAAAAAAVGK